MMLRSLSELRRPAAALAALLCLAAPAFAAEDFSAAERALFMTNQLSSLKPPATLNYAFSKTGSMEEAFDDKVSIRIKAKPDGKCCAAAAEFLGGPRKLSLPEIEEAEGNPVVLYFLERDIREMGRLTKGQPNYFRKRIRMAIAESAQIKEVSLPYRGKNVAAREISIAPYLDDPLRARFEKLANKQYVFTLSDAVPGGVYAVRIRIDGESAAAAPLLVEEMVLDGAKPAARNP
jgi:hypothetical protein